MVGRPCMMVENAAGELYGGWLPGRRGGCL